MGIDPPTIRFFVNSFMMRRADSLPFALYFARLPLTEYRSLALSTSI